METDYEAVTTDLLPQGKSLSTKGQGPRHPAWHPHEPVFLFDAYGSLWKMDVLRRSISLFWSPKRSGKFSGTAVAPAYAPQGDHVAFLLIEQGKGQIICTDSNGKAEQSVVSQVRVGDFPDWSVRESDEIVFVWGPNSNCLIFVAEKGELKIAWRGRE
jgi:hypothetical protein